jgi:hypothetical protein
MGVTIGINAHRALQISLKVEGFFLATLLLQFYFVWYLLLHFKYKVASKIVRNYFLFNSFAKAALFFETKFERNLVFIQFSQGNVRY